MVALVFQEYGYSLPVQVLALVSLTVVGSAYYCPLILSELTSEQQAVREAIDLLKLPPQIG